MTGYYDYVLGLIPAALLGVTAFLNLVGLSLTAALPGGAVVSFGIMAHAIFVRNPVMDAVRATEGRSIDRGAVDRPRGGRSTRSGRSTRGGHSD